MARSSPSAPAASARASRTRSWPPHCGPSRTRIASASSSTSTSCGRGSSCAWSSSSAAFAFCFWQNDAILEIMDRPLEKSAFHKGSNDPLEKSATFQQAQKRYYLQFAALSRAMARSEDLSPALQAQWAELSRVANQTAGAAPNATGRRPVTLGVGEPFTVTFKVVGYAALLLSLPFLLYQAYAFVLPAFSPNERAVALPLMAMVPFLFVAGVRLRVLPGPAERDRLPAELQRRQLRHPAAGAGLLPVLDHGPDRDGDRVPDPDRDPGDHARGDRDAAAAAQEPPLRDPRRSRSSRCCCPARTRSRC